VKPKRQVARAVVVEKDGSVLVLNEVEEDFADVKAEHPEGTMDTLPGGGLEKGESFEEAAVRECLEETGVKIKVKRWLMSAEDQYVERRYFLAERIGKRPAAVAVDHDGHKPVRVRCVAAKGLRLSSLFDRAAVRCALGRKYREGFDPTKRLGLATEGRVREAERRKKKRPESPSVLVMGPFDRIWQGTTVDDRVTHTTTIAGRDLLTSIERSLVQQESYEEFERRLFTELGIADPGVPRGMLSDFDTQLKNEAKLAWNEGMVVAHSEDTSGDVVLVWKAEIDGATTPGCRRNHGKTIDEIDDPQMPRHWNCRCEWLTLENPDNNDESAAMIEEMRAESKGG